MSNETYLDLYNSDGVTLYERRKITNNPLYEIAVRCGSSKVVHPAYMPTYWHYLRDRVNDPLRIVEIGVDRGNSLRMWEEAFPESVIFGVDKDEKCLTYASLQSQVYIGSQKDTEFWNRFIRESGGKFDLIVDDGSHIPSDQQASLVCLWPALVHGGLYVIEDLEYSYCKRFPYEYHPTVDVLRRQVDYVNREYAVQYGHGFHSNLTNLASLHFVANACFITKE